MPARERVQCQPERPLFSYTAEDALQGTEQNIQASELLILGINPAELMGCGSGRATQAPQFLSRVR
jgi:hypothetical protein